MAWRKRVKTYSKRNGKYQSYANDIYIIERKINERLRAVGELALILSALKCINYKDALREIKRLQKHDEK